MDSLTDAWARAVLAAPERPVGAALAEPGAPEPRAAAWAFKALCYAAWSTEPAQARPCAERVAQLLALQPEDGELQALAAWTAGVAALTEGRMPDAVLQLDLAHDGFNRIAQAQHAGQTLVPQMVALALLGRDEQAVQAGERALALFTQAGDEAAAGKVELNLGTMLTRQDRHADAARQYRRAAVRFARVGALEPSVLADLGLANALTWQFDFGESQRITQRALMRAETHALRVPQALAHLGLGRLHLLAGRYHLALRALVRATRLLDQAGAAPQQRLEADAALADAYRAVNLLPEAVALYDRVLQLAADIDAPTERARALLERSRALAGMAQAGLARADLQAARELFKAAGNLASVAGADLALAAQQLTAGLPADALDRARAAGQALADSGIVGWQLEARALEATALARCGQAERAAVMFERLLVDAQALPPVLLSSHLGLAQLAHQARDRARARLHLDRALRVVEEARALLPADEFRAAVAADAEQALALWFRLALDDGDAAGVLAAMERGRARALQLGLQQRPRADEDDTRSSQLQWLRQRWRDAVSEGQAERAADWVRRTRELEAELLEAHRRQVLTRPPSWRDDPDQDRRDFDPAELQAALQPHEALVAFQVHDNQLVACVATAHGVQWLQWPAEHLAEQVQGLRFQIEAVKYARAALAHHGARLQLRVMTHLQALHRLVWAPLLPLLQGCTRAVVVPHRQLHYLPFGALHDGAQWLLEQMDIELTPSAAVWLAGARARGVGRGQAAPRAPQHLLALGNGVAQLPHVAAELKAVAAAYGERALCLHDGAATAHALRQGVQGPDAPDVLHLACHGEFRADSPAFSALRLADGPLSLHDLSHLQMDTRLVVLSACETGQSRLAPGDELLGLVRGFMLAGARQVLATLWAVDDEATAQLMGAFHTRLERGERASAALRGAQRQLAAQGLHPFFWAAWALHGQG
jgi:CHAT domain-containing protein/tetratricopeptide (TPR) repeat protein